MKKKLFTSILSVLMLIVISVFGFAGCGSKKGNSNAISLDVTAKELVVGESFTLTATTTPADAEVVWSSSDEAIVTVSDGVVYAVSAGTATVTAKNDTAKATCSITVTAPEITTYTVSFKNGETELKSIDVAEGTTVSYIGALPSKAATEQYEYSFSGWALSDGGELVDLATLTITENKAFYAVFTETLREYTVTWNIDGETSENTLAYGATPVYEGTTPTKPTVGNTKYTFQGWATSLTGEVLETLPAVTGAVTYYAIFDEVNLQTKFEVVWKNGDEVLATDNDVAYEATPVYTGETPTKEMTVESEFVFDGWASSIDGEKLDTLPLVTADAIYYAVFKPVPRPYAITWVIEGVESTSQHPYGSVPAYDGTPVKEDSAECSFKFDGWALSADGEVIDLPAVSGVATYYAVFVVDEIFPAPKFTGGSAQYSVKTEEIFLPEGLLDEGVSLLSAILKTEGQDDVVAYENGAWVSGVFTLTDEEYKNNEIGVRYVEVTLSNEAKYSVQVDLYAGIINEFADFPAFFNNTTVPSEYDATKYPAVAPNVYGYYIVTQDLGSSTFNKETNSYVYADELALTQTAETDYQKTNGFNGVLDGQGHTLKFKLNKGGLVGLVLGNAVIKNIAIQYEDASYEGDETKKGGYGAFGYITNGSPEIRNSYIERTNNVASRSSVLGIMGRPNAKLILHNTVVNAFFVPNDATWWSNGMICPASTNAYVIHARANMTSQTQVVNFTKVFNDAIEYGSREVLLSEIEDASGFDNNYWYKENGKLIWKGFDRVTITWVKGEESTVEVFTKDATVPYTQTLPDNSSTETETVSYYWSTSEDGDAVTFSKSFKASETVTYYMVTKTTERTYKVTWNIDGAEETVDYAFNAIPAHDVPVKAEDDSFTYKFLGWSLTEDGAILDTFDSVTKDITYYAVFEKTAKETAIAVNAAILYSDADDQLFLPEEITFTLADITKITSADKATVYYENGAWVKNFDLTDEEMKKNSVVVTNVAITKGTDVYAAKVKAYAGVIDELADFPKFFNNTAVPSEYDATKYPAVAPNVYGYYIVTQDLGSLTDELAFTQTEATDYQKTNGFNGVLDGQGHKLQFKLTSGGLVGMVLGNAVIKNIAIRYEDASYEGDETKKGGYGVFGYITNGSPEIRNSYIERTNNLYHQGSVFGIMARPNAKLILRNTAIHGNNTSNSSGWYSNMWINETSTNAFLIYARANASGYTNSANFTEVVTGNTLTSDLSSFDTNYWTTTDNNLSWKGNSQATVFSSVVTISA